MVDGAFQNIVDTSRTQDALRSLMPAVAAQVEVPPKLKTLTTAELEAVARFEFLFRSEVLIDGLIDLVRFIGRGLPYPADIAKRLAKEQTATLQPLLDSVRDIGRDLNTLRDGIASGSNVPQGLLLEVTYRELPCMVDKALEILDEVQRCHEAAIAAYEGSCSREARRERIRHAQRLRHLLNRNPGHELNDTDLNEQWLGSVEAIRAPLLTALPFGSGRANQLFLLGSSFKALSDQLLPNDGETLADITTDLQPQLERLVVQVIISAVEGGCRLVDNFLVEHLLDTIILGNPIDEILLQCRSGICAEVEASLEGCKWTLTPPVAAQETFKSQLSSMHDLLEGVVKLCGPLFSHSVVASDEGQLRWVLWVGDCLKGEKLEPELPDFLTRRITSDSREQGSSESEVRTCDITLVRSSLDWIGEDPGQLVRALKAVNLQLQRLPYPYLRSRILGEPSIGSDPSTASPDNSQGSISVEMAITDDVGARYKFVNKLFSPAHFETSSRGRLRAQAATPTISVVAGLTALESDVVADSLVNLSKTGCSIDISAPSYARSASDLSAILRKLGNHLERGPDIPRLVEIDYRSPLFLLSANEIVNAGDGYTVTVSRAETSQLECAGCFIPDDSSSFSLSNLPLFSENLFQSVLIDALHASRNAGKQSAYEVMTSELALSGIDLDGKLAAIIVNHFVHEHGLIGPDSDNNAAILPMLLASPDVVFTRESGRLVISLRN